MSDAEAPSARPLDAPALRRSELVELALVALTVAGVAWFCAGQRFVLELRWVFAYSAALILAQGLARDVAKLVYARRAGGAAPPSQKLACLCGESTIGLGLLLIGAGGLSLLGVTQTVALDQSEVTALAAALMVVGFIAKDYAVAIRRIEDHGDVAVF